MNNYKDLWPKPDDLKSDSKVDLAPYGVLSMFADAILEAYDKKLFAFITARNFVKPNGDKHDFIYGLIICQGIDDGVQIKIMEVAVTDDGWYPAKVSVITPASEMVGMAQNEQELIDLLRRAAAMKSVKNNIKSLLHNIRPH